MIQADALVLPIRAHSVDLVLSAPPFPGNGLDGSEYLRWLSQAKKEIRRVLKPSGTALLVQMKVRPKAWWWRLTDEWDECLGPAHLDPPDTIPGWQKMAEADAQVLIEEWSQPGDVILDPFCGSGTAVRVAERLGRFGIGSDITVRQRAGL